MKERTSSIMVITRRIIRRGQYIITDLASALISSESIRKFKLMEEDFIRLVFDMDEPIAFEVGDAISDEIFGEFTLTKMQMPKYNKATGSYHYELEFEAPYMCWKNWLFMLTTETSGTRIRKEASWTLTNKLSQHLDEIINNLSAIGLSYTYAIENTATEAAEVRCISYQGVSLFDALKKLADEYHCEWWVRDDVIHFGKCETTDAQIEMEIGVNVEDMTIQDNRNTYANKVYFYGSKDNLPLSYRKALELTITGTDTSATPTAYKLDKKLTPAMFVGGSGGGSVEDVSIAFGSLSTITAKPTAGNYPTSFKFSNNAQYTATIEEEATYELKLPLMNVAACDVKTRTTFTGQVKTIAKIDLVKYNNDGTTTSRSLLFEDFDSKTISGATSFKSQALEIPALSENITLEPGTYAVKVDVEIYTGSDISSCSVPAMQQSTGELDQQGVVWITWDCLELLGNKTEPSALVAVNSINGAAVTNTYVRFNARGVEQYESGIENDEFYEIAWYDADGAAITPAVSVGSKIVLDDSTAALVPSAFFTTAYDDPSALARIGDTRLRLPESVGDYKKSTASTYIGHIVEQIVCFDKIYPDGKLQISTLESKQMHDYTEYEGESVRSDWQWLEYTIGAKLATSGAAFNFKEAYILPNTTLQVRFLTPEDMGWSASEHPDNCKLAGMTFDVRYNRTTNTFTIVRNQDYGTQLPNTTLHPTQGDPFVLIGWNVKTMAALGLIADAEARLNSKANEYILALEEAQFTFECTMMSDFMFDLIPALQLQTNTAQDVQDSASSYIHVLNGYDEYAIPLEGARVKIKHGALDEPKESRILGYELKLDKPYDSPRYIVGETDAYSRLAKIEREITTLN